MKLKRVTALLLAIITIVISANVFVSAQNDLPFTDVKSTDWFYNDVYLAYGRGLINGKSRDMFAPNDNLKYSEAVKLAACMRIAYFDEEPLTMSGKFWYEVYVDYCKLHGLIDKDYEWDSYATRADFMEIFAAALPDNALEAINTVEDGAIPDVPMYHKNAEAIYKLYRAGVVQGSDSAHRCNPASQVKRSEVSAILTRMMYEYARLEFSLYLEDGKDSGGNVLTEDDRDDRDDDRDLENDRDDESDWENDSDSGYDENEPNDNDERVEGDDKKPVKEEDKKPAETEKPETNKPETNEPELSEPELLPWEESNAKQPDEYTWEEFENLSPSDQEQFTDWFGTPAAFEAWMKQATGETPEVSEPSELPWDKPNGKQPDKYTWEEFENLSPAGQEQFIDWFGTPAAFEVWMKQATGETPEDGELTELPWDKPKGKQPNKYTWEEFENLSPAEQEQFTDWFGTPVAFEAWMKQATGETPEVSEPSELPWDKPNGKQPDKYTWEEFENLSPAGQEQFIDWFGTPAAFEVWMKQAKGETPEDGELTELPWDKPNGKQPEEYTWEEFENLSPAEQEQFIDWFDTPDAFIEWMGSVT